MRILLVENSPDVADAVSEALILAGHSVHVERTMRYAMDALYAQEFDCVIADGHFPSFQSWQVAQEWGLDLLRAARHAKVRGILYSGDEGLVAQARKQEFTALPKPASMTALLEAVEGA